MLAEVDALLEAGWQDAVDEARKNLEKKQKKLKKVSNFIIYNSGYYSHFELVLVINIFFLSAQWKGKKGLCCIRTFESQEMIQAHIGGFTVV